MAGWRVGVDSGGTFTDICLFDEASGAISVWKVPSTPDDPSRGIAGGTEDAIRRFAPDCGDRPASVIRYFGHGTTVATNALIQHRGTSVGLITTAGFRDLLEIGRQKRPSLYDLFADKPTTLIPRHLRLEVAERVRHTGEVETPLDLEAVRAAARKLGEAGVGAVAICFLYSFVNPEHERAAKAIVATELPDTFICASHEIAPEFREFERLSTAVVNAYLGPIMHRYIGRLALRLRELGLAAAPHLTQSNGGVIGFEAASARPVRTVLSGPSTGVVGAQAVGRLAGFGDIITFDMGGTSTDVALLKAGQAKLASEAIVHGYPLKAPMLDIHTVGAGGGSIAYVDSGGHLKVGPQSAGADPGPVAYGRGGTAPTVTDANVVLGTLNPQHLLGGRMAVRRDLAEAAIGGLAGQLGLSMIDTAQGILSVVTANMMRAIRVISVQRGHDPRDYALMAFGGAGPLHAARLARELEITRVIVPRNPGILCAMGLLLTDLRADFATTRLLPLSPDSLPEIARAFEEIGAEAEAWFAAEAIPPETQRTQRTVDMRYAGQNYELAIPLPDGGVGPETLQALGAGFEDAHRRLYGFIVEGEDVQFVTFRIEATGLVRKAEFAPKPAGPADASPALREHRQVWFPESGGFVDCPVYDREQLWHGNCFEGPAIVEQMDSTTAVLPGMTAGVDAYDNLILEVA
jgi:N-methylhydantoinase A